MKRYRIFAVLHTDISEGFVWLKDPTLRARSIVKISNKAKGKSVRCEALQLEPNFLRVYNEKPRISITDQDSALVINAWYRAKLGGLSTRAEFDLEVMPSNSPWGKLRAAMQHPQGALRVAACLGLLSVGLGLLGVVIGAVSLKPLTGFRSTEPPAVVSEWRGFLYADMASITGVRIDANRLESAPIFRSLQDCVAWGRSIVAGSNAGFECALGCALNQSVGEVVCRDSSRIIR